MASVKRFFRKIKTVLIYIKYKLFYRNISWSGMPAFLENWSMIDIDGSGKLNIGKKYEQRKNSLLECKDGGVMKVGDNVFFNRNCIITCLNSITIGDDSIFGPNVVIYDHDHEFTSDCVDRGRFKVGTVEIGKGCWIGAGAIILKDTHIGDHCVIGAGTLVKGDIPGNSVVLNKKEKTILEIKKRI